MTSHPTPEHVQRARFSYDYAVLSRAGRKGALSRTKEREKRLELQEIEKERHLAEALQKECQGNEDWCPPS